MEKMRHFLGDAFFKERRKLTAEGKSFPRGCGIQPRTENPGAKILCDTNFTIPQYTGLRISQPHSDFGRLRNLYINPSEWDGTGGPGHFCQPKVLCRWQCPNNWTRFSDIKLLNNPTICNPHIGQRQYGISSIKDKFLLQRQLPIKT